MIPNNLALQANDLGSNSARYELFLTVHGLSCAAERLSISISQQLIMMQTIWHFTVKSLGSAGKTHHDFFGLMHRQYISIDGPIYTPYLSDIIGGL